MWSWSWLNHDAKHKQTWDNWEILFETQVWEISKICKNAHKCRKFSWARWYRTHNTKQGNTVDKMRFSHLTSFPPQECYSCYVVVGSSGARLPAQTCTWWFVGTSPIAQLLQQCTYSGGVCLPAQCACDGLWEPHPLLRVAVMSLLFLSYQVTDRLWLCKCPMEHLMDASWYVVYIPWSSITTLVLWLFIIS